MQKLNVNLDWWGECDGTLLHTACDLNASLDVISLLIGVRGEELVMEKDEYGKTPLHNACMCNASLEVVSLLLGMGGEALLREKNNEGSNSLHCACKRAVKRAYDNTEDALLDEALINLLTRHSGAKVVTQTDKSGKTLVQIFIANDTHINRMEERFSNRLSVNAAILINKGIELQFGGEYSIRGLFTSTSTQEVQNQIYHDWDKLVLPALEQVMTQPHSQNLPFLQALIVNKAPPHIIKSTVHQFAASINTIDIFGKYPMDIAAHHGLAWDDGMKEVVERSYMDLLAREDASTGLLLFMVAAVGGENSYNFDTEFHLIKKSSLLVARK